VSAALRRLAASGATIGFYGDAPAELVEIALAHLGARRRAFIVEAGAGSLDRLRDVLGDDVVVVATREELLSVG
jgi:hypothetical protein